ncbi:MAG: hypothetical protein IKR76_05755, partial [Ruminococcus sp.]|nr:hypothetical protein [Ruminococcus sp.]
YIMDSDKMLDKVPRGALVLASNETPSAEKLGKAVLCEKVPGVGTSVFWLADVTSKEGEDGVYYTVYQEKNPALTYELRSENVVGEATTYYTTAGKAISFMTSRFGMVICIGSPIALMIIIELIMAIASSDDYDEEDDYDEDEFVVDDKPEKPASLDDILFTGDDSTPFAKQQLEKSDDKYEPSEEEYSDEETESDIIGAVVDIDEPEQIKPEPEEVKQPEPESEPEPEIKPEPEVHKVKLPPVEKEEAAPEVKTVKIPEQPKPQPKPAAKKPAPRPRRPKSMDTSIEDLMKLMEEQQQKLKDEINKQ